MSTAGDQDGRQLTLTPIGVFHADAVFTYDVPRQGALAGANTGRVELFPGHNFEQALADLEGFSHLWLLFWFDRNGRWRPKIQPPRHLTRKVGVFASRSPYRPNPIGMSAVRLLAVRGRDLLVAGHDLLDGTPILDVKPYLPYADAFPDASPGWTAQGADRACRVELSARAESQLAWLESHGVRCLRPFILDQLSDEPTEARHHRLVRRPDGGLALAYRTWRAVFSADADARLVTVTELLSGYSASDLADPTDRYGDKQLHREFLDAWRT